MSDLYFNGDWTNLKATLFVLDDIKSVKFRQNLSFQSVLPIRMPISRSKIDRPCDMQLVLQTSWSTEYRILIKLKSYRESAFYSIHFYSACPIVVKVSNLFLFKNILLMMKKIISTWELYFSRFIFLKFNVNVYIVVD